MIVILILLSIYCMAIPNDRHHKIGNGPEFTGLPPASGYRPVHTEWTLISSVTDPFLTAIRADLEVVEEP